MPHPTLWLNKGALDGMLAEAERAALDETGGMLLGWNNPERSEVVVSAVVGPGPNAKHAPDSFRPDGDWQQQHLGEEYEQSNGRVTYLGDWHVHPQGGFGVSRRDRRTLSRIASCAEARCPNPLMGLLVRGSDSYHLGVWRWEPPGCPSATAGWHHWPFAPGRRQRRRNPGSRSEYELGRELLGMDVGS